MKITKTYLKSLIVIVVYLFSSNSFSMLCPNNFSTINIGDSMDKIIELCGKPDSQYQYTDTQSTVADNGYAHNSGVYSQTQNYYQTSGNTNYIQSSDVKQRVITVTKFTYNGATSSFSFC